jgi:hypothetical protein
MTLAFVVGFIAPDQTRNGRLYLGAPIGGKIALAQ